MATMASSAGDFTTSAAPSPRPFGAPGQYDESGVDLCYRRTPDNLERLATALGTLNLTLRDAPPELKFRLDAQALALGRNYTFEVDGEWPLDFLGYLEPLGTYEDLLPHVETMSIGGRPTQVIGLEDLIRIKRYLGRPKDRESLLQLEAIKRLREHEGLR